jgi:hypothetical protein
VEHDPADHAPIPEARFWRTARSAIVLILLANLTSGAIAAAPPKQETEREVVKSLDTPLDMFLNDLREVLTPGIRSSHEILAGAVPHAVLYLETDDGDAGRFRDGISMVVDLARNHQLILERQLIRTPVPRAGFIISPPFQTVVFCWESHPYEDVPVLDNLWRQPFADLGDVAEVVPDGPQTSLVLDEAAARRIDEHAVIHGHRRYWIRSSGGNDEKAFGPYTWMPGLRRIPGLPAIMPLSESQGGSVGLDDLRQLFDTRLTARRRVESNLGLGTDTVWTTLPEAPRYQEPFTLWLTLEDVPVDETPFYAMHSTSSAWVALQPGAAEDIAVALPRSWQLESAAEDEALTDRLVLFGDPAAVDGGEIRKFIARHRGLSAAVLVGGKVVGTVPLDTLQTGRFLLAAQDRERNDEIRAQWEAFQMPPAKKASTTTVDDLILDSLDYFQVRLMAEPQDRELIPVTHFAAPGAAAGVVVAVENDVILTSGAVSAARLENQKDRVFLHLSLTDEGQEALSDACFTHMGKQLAIVYEDQLLCAPTIVDWEQEELSFKGLGEDWPEVARVMVQRLGQS